MVLHFGNQIGVADSSLIVMESSNNSIAALGGTAYLSIECTDPVCIGALSGEAMIKKDVEDGGGIRLESRADGSYYIFYIRYPRSRGEEVKQLGIPCSCYPPKDRNKPALCNKVFQAIRIEVNNELDDLDSLEDMINLLNGDGRLCVITFHPLEDRICKNLFRLHATGCLCPANFPKCVCGHKADIKLISRKPVMPSDEELKYNSRSASAKFRIIERI